MVTRCSLFDDAYSLNIFQGMYIYIYMLGQLIQSITRVRSYITPQQAKYPLN